MRGAIRVPRGGWLRQRGWGRIQGRLPGGSDIEMFSRGSWTGRGEDNPMSNSPMLWQRQLVDHQIHSVLVAAMLLGICLHREAPHFPASL